MRIERIENVKIKSKNGFGLSVASSFNGDDKNYLADELQFRILLIKWNQRNLLTTFAA